MLCRAPVYMTGVVFPVDATARVGSCHFANLASRRAFSAHCPNEINTVGMKGDLIGEERGQEADGSTNPAVSRW